MKSTPSPFVKANKPWIIRKTVSDYLKARNMYCDLHRDYVAGRQIPFSNLRMLSDILYESKENLYLIFNKLVDPQTGEFEDGDKYFPTIVETEFMNNVGILFHKVLVARELKYMMDHYKTDSSDYHHIKESLDIHINNIEHFFKRGLELMPRVLKKYRNNAVILSYLVEYDQYVEKTLDIKMTDLLQKMNVTDGTDQAYVQVAEYFIASGWPSRARRIVHDALQFNKNNEKALQLIDESR